MKLFGFEIKRASDQEEIPTFVEKQNDEGAINLAVGGAYGQYIDLDGTIRTEAQLVTRYRDMAGNPEIDQAIDEITNEAIVVEEDRETVQIIFDKLDETLGENPKLNKMIVEEFDNIKRLLEFDTKAYEVFRTWYRDGRLYYHKIVDKNRPDLGIQELRYIDPRKIRKVRENWKKPSSKTDGQDISLIKKSKEYFVYSEQGFNANQKNFSNFPQDNNTRNAIKIAKDSILYCTSGLMDNANKMVLSHLHKAIRPLNQLRALEDATVIYRITRAPERRIFYIDVGSLPKAKAEQYLKDMMTKYKNRLVYNAATGEIRDDRRFMTMLEDFWLPRREGGRGTEISTLPAGQNLGEMEDVKYFQRKLYKSLNVPISRLEPETVYNVGRATEINRDEIKFAKFIDRLRLKFNELFLDALETQLIMKGLLTPDEWDQIKYKLRFRYLHDNYFSELKESEILMERFNRVRDADDYAGKYVSHEWIRRHILRQSDEEYEEMDEQIEAELQDPKYNPPPPEMLMPPQEEQPPAAPAAVQEDHDETDNVLKEELINLLRKEDEEFK